MILVALRWTTMERGDLPGTILSRRSIRRLNPFKLNWPMCEASTIVRRRRTPVEGKHMDYDKALRAVLRVRDGRGFVVASNLQRWERLVITAGGRHRR
jgi:hypothetical protein